MADRRTALPANVPGPFFVDHTCIDCDACRWIAPEVFDRKDGQSRVHHQPDSAAERHQALLALVACPTTSIGAAIGKDHGQGMALALAAFPRPFTGPVLHCGWHHEHSFGAASWLLLRPEGNVLVDSPRFAPRLVQRLEELGGVRWMFLTHRDDVADHERFARHFGCARVFHEDDQDAGTAGVEHVLRGEATVALADDLRAIPTPGHTRGSTCLLAGEEFLFTGDHLAWDPRRERLHAFRDACWYDWEVQTRSMARLLEHRFAWVLPGHGRAHGLPAAEMRAQLARCIAWMQRARAR